MQQQLETLLTEIKRIQDEHVGKMMPANVLADFDAKCVEAAGIQAQLTSRATADSLAAKARELVTVTTPAAKADTADPEAVVGYMTLGAFVLASEGYARAKAANFARGVPMQLGSFGSLFEMAGRKRSDRFVGVTAKQVQLLRESKAVPTIGASVIAPDRLTELVRVTEHEQLRLADVLNRSQTSSDAVWYNRLVSYGSSAVPTAAGAVKPEATMVFDTKTETVRTIPVWIPVNNQQLADYAQLAGIINNELLFDITRELDYQMAWGSGTGQEFSGLFNDAGILAARTVGGDTVADIVRRMMTDIRRAGYAPSFVFMDPLDWEGVVLLKSSTTDQYIWSVVTEAGVNRLWGLNVVEANVATERAGNATEERAILVGDGRVGATLWDRQSATISIGWQDDQFVRNQQTILAELRAAFGIQRPLAFRKYVSVAAVAS